MANTASITKDGMGDLEKALFSLTKQMVFVGIPDDHDHRDDSAFGNAAIGYLNQNGSPAQNIPARPHLDVGIEAVQQQITDIFRTGGEAALEGDMQAAEAALDAAGATAVSSVRKTILDVIPPLLADRTLAARKRQGHESETPLNETGEYRNAITYVKRDE